MGPWHESRLRARFEETDLMGVVYYAKFLVWMEVGRINLLRDLGLTYGDWRRRGLSNPVVQAHADYKAPAHFDDEVLIKTRVSKVGTRSARYEYRMFRLPDETLLCDGYTVHALVDGSGKAVPFPPDIREKLVSG
jgi:acyl-CoA thioester hydrolase